MRNTNKTFAISAIVLLICGFMAMIDGVLQADYAIKSAMKLVLFLGIPISYTLLDKKLRVKDLFVMNRRGVGPALGLGILVYLIILGGYLLFKNIFDFSAITTSLTENIGVNRNNFIVVTLYISFVNSFLEEFFFRGFVFLTLKRLATRRFAYLFSAITFAAYHIAMMIGWFSLEVFLIVLIGLFAGGFIFNYLNEKTNTIYQSWFVHMFANFAINTIGFILFGIIPVG